MFPSNNTTCGQSHIFFQSLITRWTSPKMILRAITNTLALCIVFWDALLKYCKIKFTKEPIKNFPQNLKFSGTKIMRNASHFLMSQRKRMGGKIIHRGGILYRWTRIFLIGTFYEICVLSGKNVWNQWTTVTVTHLLEKTSDLLRTWWLRWSGSQFHLACLCNREQLTQSWI